jgi:plasmid stabilization system protein ParE
LARYFVFHRLAAKEAREAERWYAARSAGAATRFRAALEAAVRQVSDDTATHPYNGSKYRYVRLNRFPYRLIYYIDDADTARVIAVAHNARRPGYWRRRK